MNKLGILLGIGLLFALAYGNARNIANYEKSKDALVNTGHQELIEWR